MFYRNQLKTKKTVKNEFEYDVLGQNQKSNKDDNTLKYKEPKIVYNYTSHDGTLNAGYGFKDLAMPVNTQYLDVEATINVSGQQVKGLWQLKWYDSQTTHKDKYYLFYYNNEGNICYDNLFEMRYLTLYVNNTFTEIPTVTYYRNAGEDSLLLSGEGSNIMLITGGGVTTSNNSYKIISCCTHYGKLFAITKDNRQSLIYTANTDVLTWTSEGLENLDFGDGRGNLNKIISFDDYLFLFRDFGITKISIYGNDNFSISHMYFSDSYIYPNSIVQSGDKVYFLTKSGLKVFNGSSVKDIEIDCMSMINKCNNAKCYATCFNGKYFLACRADFGDGLTIGCEGYVYGYYNNTLLVYDLLSGNIEVTRGADVRQVLALNNPYKTKLVACFYNEHMDRIGELTTDGKVFDNTLKSSITFAKTDFDKPDKKKKINAILIKSNKNCDVFITNEEKTYQFSVTGSSKLQKIRTNVVGKSFTVKIDSQDSETKINKFVLQVEEEWKFFTEIILNW